MFAFLREVIEERRIHLQQEPIPAEPTNSMNINKKFLEVLRLSFKTKYLDEEIELFKEKIKAVQDKLDLFYDLVDITNSRFDDIVALAAAYFNIGLEYAKFTELADLNTAIICFSRCLELLKGRQMDRKTILISISTLNELNLVSEKVNTKKYTTKFLDTALELYLNYTLENNYLTPIHIASFIGIKEKELDPRIILDTLHYTTLQDLGIHYLAKPKDKHIFVMYIHKMLNIRLKGMISEKVQFRENCLDWALTLYDLSKYFLANDRFIEARSHIATADYVLYRFYEDTLKTTKPKKKKKARLNYLHHGYNYVCAISARSWGSYGISLLRFGMEKFSQNKSCEMQDLMSKLKIESKEPDFYIFSDLEKDLECMTNQIKETCVLNLDDAKTVFVKILRHLNTAKEYFIPETDIDSYARISLQISEGYKYLAGFQEQINKRIKLHKLRVACLEDVRKKFSTTLEKTELYTYRRIWYELVTSCSTIMELMLEETYYDESFKELKTEIDPYAKIIAENIDSYLNII